MSAAPDLTFATFKMVLSLGAVLLIVWGIHRWLRRFGPAPLVGGRNHWIKVIGTHPLGIKKSIAIVQVPGAILVLGVGTEQIELLTRIDDPDVLAQLSAGQTEPGAAGFAAQLRRFTRRYDKEQPDRSGEARVVSGR